MVELPRPVPGPREVLIHVRQSGICGSDLHMYRHGGNGPCIVTKHTCAGRESAGEVVQLGEGVDSVQVGDCVAIECGLPCLERSCGPCIEGRYNLCPRMAFLSAAPFHGTLARFIRHSAAWVHKLPDNVSTEEGSLSEPLVVVLAALKRAGVKMGDSVLIICGAGPIGIIALIACRAAGCEPITITDLVASRLEFARKVVPSVRKVLVERDESAEDVARRAREAAGTPARIALEATGFESSIHAAIYSVDHGGTVFVLGMGGGKMQNMPYKYLQWREIDLRYQYLYAHQYPKALRLIAGGVVDLKPVVTHRFKLADALEAFKVASDPARGAIKVQIGD